MLRLDKIVADSGLFSRSEASALIKGGHVAIGSRVAFSGAEKCDPYEEQITVDGKPLEYHEFRYIMLNKPQGYISSTADKRETTVMDLLDKRYSRLGLFPAGRLDKDAEGLLLLTNDGEFAHRITSPSKKVRKKYFVEIEGTITDTDSAKFASGLTLEDGTKCMPAILEPALNGAYVTLYEGKFHQVKRMMAALGKPVVALRRVAIGNLILDEILKPGEYRELNDEIGLIFDDWAIQAD
jgi:16S rRNA pseudouridine516 synthase